LVNEVLKRSLQLIVLFLAMNVAGEARAYEKPPYGPGQVMLGNDQVQEADFKDIKIEEKLGAQLDLEKITLRDEAGTEHPLKYWFRGKPMVLALIYFKCPGLCGLLMNGVVGSLKRINFDIGTEYDVLFVSINPEEGAELAADKKENYIKDYMSREKSLASVSAGWHFLTGTDENVRALAKTVGFGYRKDEASGEYSHSAGFFVLTPTGVLSRVHFGVEFEPRDVHLSIVEAANGQVGSVVDKLLLFCYRYNPHSKGYALAAMNLVRAGGAVTLVVFGFYLAIFWFRQRRITKERKNEV